MLEAAEAAFRREGYHGASLGRIAREAGFTTGAVYSAFESKADMMLVLIADRATRRREMLEDVFADGPSKPEEALAEFSRRYASQVAEERDWSAALIEFMVVVGRDERLRDRYAAQQDATRAAVAELTRRWLEETGVKLKLSPERLATATMALNIGLTVQRLLAPAKVPQSLYVDAQLALAGGAVASEGGD